MLASTWAHAAATAKPEVPLRDAKIFGQRAADTLRPGSRLGDARLYRGLEGEPMVWALEFHDPQTDNPITVLAAATRTLPPIVMAWHGLPWHRDPERIDAARAAFAASHGQAAGNWDDFRWTGPLDFWVAQQENTGAAAFFNLVDRGSVTAETVATQAAARAFQTVAQSGTPSRAAAPSRTGPPGSRPRS